MRAVLAFALLALAAGCGPKDPKEATPPARTEAATPAPTPAVPPTAVKEGSRAALDPRALTLSAGQGADVPPVEAGAADLATLQTFVDALYPGATPEKRQQARAADAAAFRKGIP